MIAKFDNLHNIISSIFPIHFLNHLFTHHSKYQNITTYQDITTLQYIQLQYTSAPAYHLRGLTFTCPPISLSLPILLPTSSTFFSFFVSWLSLTSHSQCYISLSYYFSLPMLHLRQVSTSYLIYPTHLHRLLPIYPILPNRDNKKTITQNLQKFVVDLPNIKHQQNSKQASIWYY